MSGFTKILSALTAATLIVGFLFDVGVINVDAVPELYVVFPIGASLFGLLLITRLLKREVAAFDAGQRTHNEASTAGDEPDRTYNSECHSPGHA